MVKLILTTVMSFSGNHVFFEIRYVYVYKKCIYFFKLEEQRHVIHCCHDNQFMRKCLAKNHDLRE